MPMDGTIPSSAIEVLPTHHLGVRCAERHISGGQLEQVIKYGTCTEAEGDVDPDGLPRWLFRYNGVSYVTDHYMHMGITAWVDSCWGFDLEKKPITREIEDAHQEAVRRASDHSTWNSHAVVVVDQR